VGIGFGPDVTKRWCTLNKVTGIIRSHEVRQGECPQSFSFSYPNKTSPQRDTKWNMMVSAQLYVGKTHAYTSTEQLSQVFSAPNYVDTCANKGAFVSLRYLSGFVSFVQSWLQIRIDSAGKQTYNQFEVSPHPPKKPMAYAQGGLASLLM
jgi:serine/threonine-protein phosphatase 5